ncbi:MAG: hypothetical protein ABI539_12855 [Acidobacteriota bacterium]
MWESRDKTSLIIEVWEKLDCESVGSAEIEAIDEAVSAQFGKAAVDSPMVTARLLADEGAQLRHSEILELYLKRSQDQPYAPVLRNIIRTDTFALTLSSLKNAENFRKRLTADNDREGLRLLREEVLDAKKRLLSAARTKDRGRTAEIVQWLTLWLQSPELFENWIALRRATKEFNEKFGSD